MATMAHAEALRAWCAEDVLQMRDLPCRGRDQSIADKFVYRLIAVS